MKKILLLFSLLALILTYMSCSKSDPAPPSNPCSGVIITVTATVTNATTGQSNGVITATATGTGLTYNLNGGAFQSSGTFTGLAAGTYTISAKNSGGCTGSAQFVVGTTNPCTGVNVVVTGTVTNATAANNDGSINVSATGGTSFTYSINGGTFQAGNVFSGLAAGTYTITAKNNNGCTGSQVFTVTNPCTGVNVVVTGTVTNATTGQSNGSINVSATGGTSFTYSINGVTFQAGNVFSGLAAGTYTITAKNNNGCTGSSPFTVGTTNPCAGVTITVTATTTAASPCATPNGGIAASATGGATPYTYSNGGPFQSSAIFNGLNTGNYTVTAKDANGCTGTLVVTVAAAAQGPLFTAVKAVLASNCALSGCHLSPNPQNGIDFSVNCTIVANSANIKARAVDGVPSFMPPSPSPQLSAADKQKIVNWVNAGGQFTN